MKKPPSHCISWIQSFDVNLPNPSSVVDIIVMMIKAKSDRQEKGEFFDSKLWKERSLLFLAGRIPAKYQVGGKSGT